jgi:two-component system, NtrC family, sensor histidine kinase KinB
MRLRTWLILGYSAVLLLAALGLGLGLATVLGLAATSERMVGENFQALEVASRLRSLTGAQQRAVIARLAESERDAMALLPPFQGDVENLLAEARAVARSEEALARVARLQEALDRLQLSVSSGPGPVAGDAELPHPPSGEVTLAPVGTISIVAAFAAVSEAAQDFYRYHHEAMVERGVRIQRQSQRLALALALLAAFTVLIGVMASLRLANRLAQPMERLAEAAARVAERDFDIRLQRSGLFEADRVAQRFEAMARALGRLQAMDLGRLLAERRRLDRVIAAIDDGLVILDESGRIERINPVAESQLGLSLAAAEGKRVEEVLDLPQLAAEIHALGESPQLESEGDSDIELEREGEKRTLSYSLLPFSDAERPGLVLVLRDVTGQRRFERMRTEFVLRASHELRTPVTSLRMALGLLLDKLALAPDSREADLLQTLDEETQRLTRLLGDLLDLSRLYAGARALQREAQDPQALLRRCQQRFAPIAADAGIELSLQAEAGLPWVAVDAQAMDRVLDNLLSNAIRHTPRGGSIALSARAEAGQLRIEVRDSGEGIARQDRARVFEPFVQIGPRAGGSGLGLAMCRELVQQHGGRIRLASRPGEGATFSIELPLTGSAG